MVQFQCLVCPAQFAKPDHLARHELSHGNERAYTCGFCPLNFNRRDALLRHWRTCRYRIESGLRPPVSPAKKRGRKINACLRCAQLKKKCSGATPCTTCAVQGQQCTYLRSSTTKTTPGVEREDQVLAPPVLSIPQNLNTYIPDTESFSVNLLECNVANWWPLGTEISGGSQGYFQNGLFPFSLLGDKVLDVPPLNIGTYPLTDGNEWDPSINILTRQPFIRAPSYLHLDIRFLANVTSTHGIASSFEIGSSSAWKGAMSSLRQGYNIPLFTRHYERAQQTYLETGCIDHNCLSANPSKQTTTTNISQPLLIKSQEIIKGIRETLSNRAPSFAYNANSSQLTERSYTCFFSPPNLERFISIFWHFWYPNWPVFHEPTFDITQKPPQLIAVLSLIGACVSPDKVDRDRALSLLEVVEDWIFNNPDFCEDIIPETDDEFMLSQIETRLDMIRAAYALIIVMTWEGNANHIGRARRRRFTETVCVSRSLYFFCTPQRSMLNDMACNDHSRWKLYSLREECIRTLVYVFMLDCAFVMFNNTAPRMVIDELQFSLASPEDWFYALTADDWVDSVQNSPRMDQGICLSSAIRKIMQGELDDTNSKVLERTNLLNYFAITSAFHNLIYLHNYGLDSGSRSPHLSCGLKNWIQIWHARVPSPLIDGPLERGLAGRLGFYRYAREYWCLAVILYSQFNRVQSMGESFGAGPCSDDTKLARAFDSSDMGQLHELIVQFKGMDIRQVLN